MAALVDELREALSGVRERIDSTLSRTRDEERRPLPGEQSTGISRRVFRGPDLDVEETEDAIVVRAELPGLAPEDVNVELSGNRLILRGEKREERTDTNANFRVVERRYGAFVRAVTLPDEVNPEDARAEFKNGVLRVSLPRANARKGQRSKINVRAA